MTIVNATMADIQLEIEINAPAEKVWQSLTDNIGQWWPADFYTGGEESSRSFSLEAFPGGRMMESWGDGGGLLWGNVVSIQPGVKLQLLGSTFPNWGGPVQWFGTWDLVKDGDKTILKFSEHTIGKNTESGSSEKDKGWRFLWNVLKSHAEGKPAPEWVD